MSEAYYINQILNKKVMIEEIERKIINLKENLFDLNEFFIKHLESVKNIEENFNIRRNKIINANINEKEVKIYTQYKDYMMGYLNGNKNTSIIERKYIESKYIKEKIKEIEEKIAMLIKEKNELEINISNLNNELNEFRRRQEEQENERRRREENGD